MRNRLLKLIENMKNTCLRISWKILESSETGVRRKLLYFRLLMNEDKMLII